MLKENAEHYIQLGREIEDARLIFELDENYTVTNVVTGERHLNERGQNDLRGELGKLLALAKKLELPVSMQLPGRRLGYKNNLPQTIQQFEGLLETMMIELGEKLFLFVPQHVASYYESDKLLNETATTAFPQSSEEVRAAGTCLAMGMHTASVFHSMRAAEIGLRALGADSSIKVKGDKPLELAEWREILDGLAVVVRDIENLPNNTPDKEPRLAFYSEACAQFRFFKNGWRVRVAHARATYTEPQAREALDHVRSFFETLAARLKEPT